MNQAYRENLKLILYKWVSKQKHAHPCQNSCSVCFYHEQYHAVIHFHKENIIELSIQDKISRESVFYLHFELQNLKTTIQNIQLFFQFLKSPQIKQELYQTNFLKPIKILLSCTSGLTTSYFAHLMKESFQQNHDYIQIDAVSYFQIENIHNQYDYILLAPQIAHLYQDFKKKYGDKVMIIDTMDFAIGNVNHVFYQLSKKGN